MDHQTDDQASDSRGENHRWNSPNPPVAIEPEQAVENERNGEMEAHPDQTTDHPGTDAEHEKTLTVVKTAPHPVR